MTSAEMKCKDTPKGCDFGDVNLLKAEFYEDGQLIYDSDHYRIIFRYDEGYSELFLKK